ncbi:MAG: adenosine deaminase [Eubacteriales bacterium]|nr:adenosine deaminase [Eubacteriales bacterium]
MDLSSIDYWVDLHLHLDGSLSLKTVRKLAKMQNIEVPEDDGKLNKLLVCPSYCESLNQYLQCFDFPLQLLQTKAAVTESVRALISELKKENTIYAEIRFAPQLHCRKGLSQTEVVEAAIAGLDGNMKLILCCMRGKDNEEQNIETIRLARDYQGKGVVAVDLAGAEGIFPNSDYKALFAAAKEMKVPYTIHAGEAAGAESVRCAVEYGAARIGHGVRSYEDSNVMNLLKKSGVMLELCPTSNLDTKVFDRLEDYPIAQYLKAGIPVCINTDNRTVSNTTIRKEYEKLSDTFGLTIEDVNNMLVTACKYSFADKCCKEDILRKAGAL